MPTRGYRKGVSDRKMPVPCSLRTHISERMFAKHAAEADTRHLTYSRLLFEILKAHQAGTRLEAPQPRAANSQALRDLCRIGNNLNQIAHQANLMHLPLIERETRDALAQLVATVQRL